MTCLAHCLDQEFWKAIEYLKEQIRVLKEQQEKEKRILLTRYQSQAPTEGKRPTSPMCLPVLQEVGAVRSAIGFQPGFEDL